MNDRSEVLVELEARRGPWNIGPHYSPIDGWLYNGDAPGPLIEARLGDTLVVRLTNALPRSTSLGLSRPSANPRARNSHPGTHQQRVLQPQRTTQPQRIARPHETVEYRFELTHTGTFWYHPAGDVMQIERGLHGVLVVRPAAGPPAGAERIIVLDDVCLGPRAVAHRRPRNGCMGNVLLMNGRVQPQLPMPAATVEHWRVVNVAHARPVRFSLGGAPFRRSPLESSDNRERLRCTRITETMIEPGGTADLMVGPFEAGTRVHVQSVPHHAGPEPRPLAPVFGTLLIGP